MNCQTHNLKIHQVCINQECKSRYLCEKCTVIHTTGHQNDILDYNKVFNDKGQVILISKMKENLKQRVQQGINLLKEQQFNLAKEVEDMVQDMQTQLQTHLQQQVALYTNEIDQYYNQQLTQLSAQQNKVNAIQKQNAKTQDDTSPQSVESEIIKFVELSKKMFREVIETTVRVEQRSMSKQQVFVNKKNKENCCTQVKKIINQHPLIQIKCNEQIPFEKNVNIDALNLSKQINIHSDWVNNLLFLDSNHIFASASSDAIIKISDLDKPNGEEEICKLEGHLDAVNTIIFWNDSTIISGSMDTTIRIWDWKYPDQSVQLCGHDKPVRTLLKLENELFASAGGDKKVFIWSFKDNKQIKQLQPSEDTILSLAKLNNNLIAAGTASGKIDILDYQTNSKQNEFVRSFSCHNLAIKSLLYLPSEQTIASAGDDNLIVLTKYLQPTAKQSQKLIGHKASVSVLTHLNLPNCFASGGWDGQIIVWDISKGSILIAIQEQDNYIQSLIYMNDGRTIISSGTDMIIRVWTLDVDQLSSELITEGNEKGKGILDEFPISQPTINKCEICSIF